MDNISRKKIITIPNMLSFCRILMIPVIVWLYLGKEDSFATAVLLTVSGLTDVVDGIIARKCNMVSDFGKAFDPVADKLTQIAMLFCLVTRFPHMSTPLWILIAKEVCTGVMSLVSIRKSGKVDGAVWHGKVTTVLLYSVMALHLLWNSIALPLSYALVGVATGMMLLSFVGYFLRNIKVLFGKEPRQEAEKDS